MTLPQFDVGNLITLGVIFTGMAVAWGRINARLDSMGKQQDKGVTSEGMLLAIERLRTDIGEMIERKISLGKRPE